MDVKRVLKRHGFTQADLAKEMGRTEGSISSLLSYGRHRPSTLRKIASIIGADYDEFFEDERIDAAKKMKAVELNVDLPTGAIEQGVLTMNGKRFMQVLIPIDDWEEVKREQKKAERKVRQQRLTPKAIVKRSGFTQAEIAERLGVTQSAVSIAIRHPLASRDLVKRIAATIGVESDLLLPAELDI